MKRILLAVGILAASQILLAQSREEALEKTQIKIEEYKARLELTEEQETQWKELRKKYRPQFKSIRDDESKSRSEKLRAVADVEEEREAELATILSQEQMDELQVIRKERKEKRIDRRKRKARSGY